MNKKLKNEINRLGYYAVIPATVLYNKELKPNEKLLYAIITNLSNKEGYCYASNSYLAEQFNVDATTISKWITDLRRKNFIYVEMLKNEKKEIISRKIFPCDTPHRLFNLYPYRLKSQYPIDEKAKDNNINNNNINTLTVKKISYADKVNLYEYEYNQLIDEYGLKKTDKCIEELDLYKKSKGVEYEDDFATIKRWVVTRVEEIESRKSKTNAKSKYAGNFEQREYSKEFFEDLYSNKSFINEKEKEKENENDMEM